LSAVRDCLFNLFAATLHIGSPSSNRKVRTRHSVVTEAHLSHGFFRTKETKYTVGGEGNIWARGQNVRKQCTKLRKNEEASKFVHFTAYKYGDEIKDYEIGITCSIHRKDKKKFVRVHSLLMPCSIRRERLRERLLTC